MPHSARVRSKSTSFTIEVTVESFHLMVTHRDFIRPILRWSDHEIAQSREVVRVSDIELSEIQIRLRLHVRFIPVSPHGEFVPIEFAPMSSS